MIVRPDPIKVSYKKPEHEMREKVPKNIKALYVLCNCLLFVCEKNAAPFFKVQKKTLEIYAKQCSTGLPLQLDNQQEKYMMESL